MIAKSAVVFLLVTSGFKAQSVAEVGDHVVYEDGRGGRLNLGEGFSPVLSREGRVVFLRGHNVGYGSEFDCADRSKKNWVSIYDPIAKVEKVLWDEPLPFDGGTGFCVFEQVQLSHDGSILYLVSPVYATSGSLAIVRLKGRRISYVPGVNSVFVIEIGPHRDELIYQRRVRRKSLEDGLSYPAYPLVHAHADGRQIAEVSNEGFTVGGNDRVPLLRRYLKMIGGTITVRGQKLP